MTAEDKPSNRPPSHRPPDDDGPLETDRRSIKDRPPHSDHRANSDREPSQSSPLSERLSHNSVDEIRSKPLIELLRIAEVQGVISGWTVNGPSIVLQRNDSHILVRAVDAAALLVRLMSERNAND